VSDCRRTVDRLAPYVDRVLPASERADVEQHLARCQPCRGAARAEEGARAVLREKAPDLQDQPLPPGLRGRCEALASEHLKRTPARTWRLIPVSITAVLTIFIATVVFSLATQQSNTLLAAQLTVDHSKCFGLFADADSPVADAGHLEDMLLDDYGWKVRVMYRVNGQDVSLFMLDGVTRRDADVISLGHRSRIWSRGGTTYVLVAPTAAGELGDAARYLMREAH
jgi:hypothetical protein